MSDRKFFPTRKLGQNFLKDRNTLNKICDAGELRGKDHVLEIGPGFGSLTEILCTRAGHVTAVEKDRRLYEHLREHFSHVQNLELIHDDILKTGISVFSKGEKLKIISNLPYSISSQILIRLIEERASLILAVIMLQKEVAERIASGPGSKTYGSLSVIIQTFFRVSRVIKVPPSAFRPKPKVDSSVLKLVPLDELPVEITDLDIYKRVVRASFSSRRKIIKNSLSSDFPGDMVITALQQAEIDINRRAEELDLEDFARLSNKFYLLQQSTSSDNRSF